MYENKNTVDLTVKIIQEIKKIAEDNNKTPVLVILPTQYDIEYMKETDHVYYSNLITSTEKFIDVIDIGSCFINHDRDKIFYTEQGYGAHLSPEGNKVAADFIHNYLKTNILAK